MSFTSNVKSEVSSLDVNDTDKIAELSALCRTIGNVNSKISLTTENASVARRIFNLVKDIYNITPNVTVRRGYNFKKGYVYIININDIKKIISDLSLDKNIPDEYLVDDDDTLKGYLRGVFLGVGSVSDPKKSSYHLEFIVDNLDYAEFLQTLLNTFALNSKILKRESKYMVYIKEAEKISDFLRVIGASGAVLYFEDIRIYRDHKNMTNRLNNCEQANVDKIIMSASEQIKDINLIEETTSLEVLGDKVKTVAIYRRKYPESSLSELAEIISIETGDQITKSGLNHRLKKIKDLAIKIRNSKEI